MNKTRTIALWSAVLMTALVCGTALRAQSPPAKSEKALVPLKVQVTLARYEGEKKTSSLPFTLWVNANDQQKTALNVGVSVAVPVDASGGIQYRNVGTNLTCMATGLDDGRFGIMLSISDSSITGGKDKGENASFQSLTTQNYLLLRDGQTAQFIAATDKVTGEVTKVDVTVTVLK